MAKRKIPTYIRPAGYLRTSGAFFVDFGLVLLLGVILYFTLGSRLLYSGVFHGEQATAAYNDLCVDSGFSTLEGNKLINYAPDVSKKGLDLYEQYEEVEQKAWTYFYEKVGNGGNYVFFSSDEFSSSAEKGSAAYLKDVGRWIYSHCFGIQEDGTGNTFFTIPSSEGFAYDAMPVLKPSYQAIFDEKKTDAASLDSAKSVFLSIYQANSSKAFFQRAKAHFMAQPKLDHYHDQEIYAFYGSLIPSVVLGPLVFFVVLPLVLPNGQTLGKKIFGVAILGADGYSASKGRILFHYSMIVLPMFATLIPHPLIVFPLFLLYFVVDFIVLVLSKNHQAFHDKASSTVVINAKSSLWFPSPEAEKAYIAKNPSSLPAKYREEERKADEGKNEMEDILTAQRDAVVDSRTLEHASYVKEQAKKEAKEIVYDNDADPKGEGDFVDGKGEDDAH